MTLATLIVNTGTNNFLGVPGDQPRAGEPVQILSMSTSNVMTACWVITDVNGGQIISLNNHAHLFLDLRGDSGNDVVLNSTPSFLNSNLWSTADLPSGLISLCGKLLCLDTVNFPFLSVMPIKETNSQSWTLTSLDAVKGVLGKSPVFR